MKRSRAGRLPAMRFGCPKSFARLAPKPVYARAPDARRRSPHECDRGIKRRAGTDRRRIKRPRFRHRSDERRLRRPLRRGLDPVAMRRDPADARRQAGRCAFLRRPDRGLFPPSRDQRRGGTLAPCGFARVSPSRHRANACSANSWRPRAIAGQVEFTSRFAKEIRQLSCIDPRVSVSPGGAANITGVVLAANSTR